MVRRLVVLPAGKVLVDRQGARLDVLPAGKVLVGRQGAKVGCSARRKGSSR
jgi:hypothetical protein